MLDEIKKKKELLYGQLDIKSVDSEEVLKISEELDKLILEYYRNHGKDNEI